MSPLSPNCPNFPSQFKVQKHSSKTLTTMASPPSSFLTVLLLILPLLQSIDALSCTRAFLDAVSKLNVTQNCQAKPLNVEFAWNFYNDSRRLEIAFAARLDPDADTAWLAWGINMEEPRMVGTKALIGIKNGPGSMRWDKYNITDATKRGCPLKPVSNLGLNVTNFTFGRVPDLDNYYMIRATIILPKEYNSSRTQVVWQIGYKTMENGEPGKHPRTLDNMDSAETIDLVSAHINGYKPYLRWHLRTAHGVLNIIGWGILFPVGVIIARYMRKYPVEWPVWWFSFHVGCQIAGYIIGVTGWSIGLCLGEFSEYYTFLTHRILGIIIFTFTTIQMMALRLKPKKYDEFRAYWNMYHHSLGYSLLALMAANIFQGTKIMKPNQAWKWAYIGVLGMLGSVAMAFEVYTWVKFGRDRWELFKKKQPGEHETKKSNPQSQK